MLQLEDKLRLYTLDAIGNEYVLVWVYVEKATPESWANPTSRCYKTVEAHGYFGPAGQKFYEDDSDYSTNPDALLKARRSYILRSMNNYLESLKAYKKQLNDLPNIRIEIHNEPRRS